MKKNLFPFVTWTLGTFSFGFAVAAIIAAQLNFPKCTLQHETHTNWVSIIRAKSLSWSDIQHALDRGEDFDIVELPPGRGEITNSLTFNSKVSLHGSGTGNATLLEEARTNGWMRILNK